MFKDDIRAETLIANPTIFTRTQDCEILAIIPKYKPNSLLDVNIEECPQIYVITRTMDDNLDYFVIDKYLMGTDGEGILLASQNLDQIKDGHFIAKDVPFMTFPKNAQRAAQISVSYPHDGTYKALFGPSDQRRALPKIGDKVGDDGVLCVCRHPNRDGIDIAYIEPGSQIIDIDVSHHEQNANPFLMGATEYRDAYNACLLDIYKSYVKHHVEYPPTLKFMTLVEKALPALLGNASTSKENFATIATLMEGWGILPKESILKNSVRVTYTFLPPQ